jgi:hypothetical protein
MCRLRLWKVTELGWRRESGLKADLVDQAADSIGGWVAGEGGIHPCGLAIRLGGEVKDLTS